MEYDNFEIAISYLKESKQLNYEPLSKKAMNFLNRYNVKPELIEFFKRYSFKQDIRFKNVNYYRVNEIENNNTWDENLSKCIESGLLVIGAGLNGDPIVIDLITNHIGFVFHDELWENENANVRDEFISMKCSVGEFFYNSLHTDNYPIDGYDVEQYIDSCH
jgi:hypothetical protein